MKFGFCVIEICPYGKTVSMKEKISRLVKKIKKAFTRRGDPDGSYTGNPIGGGKPTQDSDDL